MSREGRQEIVADKPSPVLVATRRLGIKPWYIERENGERIAGPFTTRDDAWRARDWVEKALSPETFWIREAGSQ